MSTRRVAQVLTLLGALLLAGCNNGKEPTYQGWVEAELIFVGPDEAGRIETLAVREGDQVEKGALIFTLDDELQLADVAMQEASVKNAQIAYDRALALLKTSAGMQKTLDEAEAALRTAQARLNSAQTRLPTQGLQPGHGQRPTDLFPWRGAGCRRQAHRRPAAAGQSQASLLCQRGDLAQAQARRRSHCDLRRLRKPNSSEDHLHRPQLGIHAPGDLQLGRAFQARIHDRGANG